MGGCEPQCDTGGKSDDMSVGRNLNSDHYTRYNEEEEKVLIFDVDEHFLLLFGPATRGGHSNATHRE